MGRHPKKSSDRRDKSIRLPLTAAEKTAVEEVARAEDEKAVTWCRSVVLNAVASYWKKRAEK